MLHVIPGLVLLLQLQAPTTPAPTTTTPAPTPTTEAPAAAPATTTTTTSDAAPAKSLLPPKTKPRLLVIDLIDKGAGPEITNAVTQAVQGQALSSHAGETVTTTQIRVLLDAQANQQVLGCDSEACMTDIGKLVEADVILGGNVAKVGDDVVITVLTVDPSDGRRLKQEQRKTPINRDLYYYAAKQLAALALTGKAADPRVPVLVNVLDKSTPVEGTIVVDGKIVGTASSARQELDPGQHELVIKRSGFADWRTVLDVQEGTPLEVNANLVQERLYLWPVAIATGVAAVGTGVVAALMFDYARGMYDGSGFTNPGNKQNSGGPYTTVSPTNTAELCQRERDIAWFSGRMPADGEAYGNANGCAVGAGPGLGAGLGIASGVLGGATVILLGTDLIIGAVASE